MEEPPSIAVAPSTATSFPKRDIWISILRVLSTSEEAIKSRNIDKALSYPSTFAIHLALFAVQIFFSSFYTLARWAFTNDHTSSPIFFIPFRLLIAAPCMFLSAARSAQGRKALFTLSRPQLVRCGLVGIFGITINQGCFVLGLSLSSASVGAILQCLTTIFATIMCMSLKLEKVSIIKITLILVAASGSVLMADPFGSPSSSSSSSSSFLGPLLFVINTFAFALHLILMKPLLDAQVPATIVMSWAFFFGTVSTVLLVLIIDAPMFFASIVRASTLTWLVLMFTAFIATFATFLLNTWANGFSSPLVVAIYVCAEPLTTCLMAAATLGERINGIQVIGGVLILGGVLGVIRAKSKEEKEQQPQHKQDHITPQGEQSIHDRDDIELLAVQDEAEDVAQIEKDENNENGSEK